jgi:hypothetical protein
MATATLAMYTHLYQINRHVHASATPGYSTTRFHQSAGGSGSKLRLPPRSGLIPYKPFRLKLPITLPVQTNESFENSFRNSKQ